jgi:hypothetical protein
VAFGISEMITLHNEIINLFEGPSLLARKTTISGQELGRGNTSFYLALRMKN